MRIKPLFTLPRTSALLSVTLCITGAASQAGAAAPVAWTQAGRQGIIRLVIVPQAQAGDVAAYEQQIALMCAGQESCFANFFTNSTGAALDVPLPDAIASEATAVLRRSAKQGVDSFRWSCRMKKPGADCF
jgi:hypothetical protein